MAWVWLSRRNSFGQLSPFIFSNIFGSKKAFCEIGGSRFGFFGTMRLFGKKKISSCFFENWIFCCFEIPAFFLERSFPFSFINGLFEPS